MESFVIRPMTWPVLRLFSRNPLIRTSDRIEAAVATLAGLLVVIAAACAGVIGTMIHDTETQNYLEQARTRHAVVATAVDDSKPAASPETTASTVHARWQVNGLAHADVLGWDYAVKAGDPLQIWVDGDGNRVDRPTPVAARRRRRVNGGSCGMVDRGPGRRTSGVRCARPREPHAGRSVGPRDSIPRRRRRRAHQPFAMISFVERRPWAVDPVRRCKCPLR